MESTARLTLIGSLLGAALSLTAMAQETQSVGPYKDFKGKIELDIRDSIADWGPFTPKRAPEGAPNILFVLYDDTGLASWSPYGGRINMPTLQKLADNGLRYTQWHTTALCSPTRSTFLTGRNHHVNGMRGITEGANGFPGASGRMPAECATIGTGASGQRLQHVLAGQESQRARGGHRLGRESQASGRCRRASTASTAS